MLPSLLLAADEYRKARPGPCRKFAKFALRMGELSFPGRKKQRCLAAKAVGQCANAAMGAPRVWPPPVQGNGKLSGVIPHATYTNPKGSCRKVNSTKRGWYGFAPNVRYGWQTDIKLQGPLRVELSLETIARLHLGPTKTSACLTKRMRRKCTRTTPRLEA